MKNEYCTIFCNMLLLDKLIRTSFFIVCQKICDFSTLYSYFRSKIQYISRIVSQYFGIYIIWVLIHYMSAHIYTKICVPSGLFVFVLSFILTPSPYCYTLRWIIFNGGNYITSMWVILGMWIVNKLPIIRE